MSDMQVSCYFLNVDVEPIPPQTIDVPTGATILGAAALNGPLRLWVLHDKTVGTTEERTFHIVPDCTDLAVWPMTFIATCVQHDSDITYHVFEEE